MANTVMYPKNLVWLWITLLVLILDLWTKSMASGALDYADPVYVLPVFNLTLLHNTGAAFSFLAAAGGWQRWFFAALAIIVAVVIVRWLLVLRQEQRWQTVALCLVLGGALGNLYDRMIHGYVVDFLSFHYADWYFPAFNIADVGITLGALMLIPEMLGWKKSDTDAAADKRS
ncbi:signal peptidase II [Pokkaliibacter sp. CJK22405]|uniref:signal peptidase II n=1 Tax=Pokkaliibacter sp. CJK22405 TaxID=3384615 RepID=UPI0039850FD5